MVFQGVFVLAAAISAAVTFIALARSNPTDEIPQLLRVLLALNTMLLAGMAWAVVSRYLAVRSRGRDKGGRLARRFMLLFAMSAMIPALVVSIFLWASISRGIDTWFGERVFTLVEETATVARESLVESEEVFEEDTRNVAIDINNAAVGLTSDKVRFEEYLGIQGYLRNMAGAFVVDDTGQVLATGTNLGPSAAFPQPSPRALVDAQNDDVVVTSYQGQGVATSLKRLANIDGAYLYLVKPFDTDMALRLERAQANLTDYRLAEERSSQTKTLFVWAYLQIVALVLLLSVRLAQSAAERISDPITRLATAAGEVARGKGGVTVNLPETGDEVEDLSHSFNIMTQTLDQRRSDLVQAREDADVRRIFVETLLAEMSSGVIRLDQAGRVTLANPSAEALLGRRVEEGDDLSSLAPEIAEVFSDDLGQASVADLSVNLNVEGETRHVRLKVGPDGSGGRIITLDDATRLVTAQRQLAWRDVARRVAHEIRNPLTPIQLSAERLKRRYSDKIEDDSGVFERCVNTILRQVSDIGRMVQEFSDFARMPKPSPNLCDLTALLNEVIFAQQVVTPDIQIRLDSDEQAQKLLGDERLLSQAFGNLVKNAAEAINSRGPETETVGEILVQSRLIDHDQIEVVINDNGPGFPPDARDSLLEPYVTMREGGTGLGLAIVNRIIMDHGGSIQLMERLDGDHGATVRITLPAWSAGTTTSPIADNAPAEALS
ncbi:ATP-binding protein [Hyphomonas sp. FCG-A18]|uniref:sensor histidine kinase NtrY-like n=1 Tax=Hyphomonas sp. FCG-A18 TaxID=3080019 RepID=UPI002B2B92B3|nr:ATP-binding protein [Hyphomonas sp. FCG-A18]